MSHDFKVLGTRPDGTGILGTDGQALARFFADKRTSLYRADENGEPISVKIDMFELIQPGDKEPTQVEADQDHKRRFPQAWEAYQRGEELKASGDLLEILFPVEKQTVSLLNAHNIFTIQQLANLSDSAMGNFPFGRSLKDKAANYLKTNKGGSEFEKLAKQNEALLARLEALEQKNSAPVTERPKRKYTKRETAPSEEK